YIEGVDNTLFASIISLDTATGLAYIGGGGGQTPGFTIVDTRTEQVVGTQFVGLGVATVTAHQGRLYVGEACTNGRVFVLDAASRAEVGRVEPNITYTGGACNNSWVRAFHSDGSTAWAIVVNAGILEFDARSLAVIRRFDVRPPTGDGDYGVVRGLALLNERWLYGARLEGGIDEIDLTTGLVTSHYPTLRPPDPSLRELAILPSRGLMFVTGDPDATGPANVRAPILLQVPGLRLRYAFPQRPGRIHDNLAVHPDGRRVYVMAEFDVDVYIVRP
ncbi:MAG TPA: hypothetical protein VNL98_07225, partial [Gemmatimonadales bacterium]|nr:hypothetical protein [Gemmatimonadales bacterium]